MNDRLFQTGVRAHQAGNFSEAARIYGEVLRGDPRHFPALFSMGFLHYQAGHFDDAQRIIGEALRINPHSAEAFFTRGCAFQRLNRGAEALICFDRALGLKPDFIEAQSNRGATLMGLKRYEQALESLDIALALDPSHAAAWNNRGCVLQNMGRYQEALSCFQKALASQGDFVEAFVNRGTANASLKRYQDAADDFERALTINPELPYAKGHHMLYRMHACDWRNFAANRAGIVADLQAGKRAVYPFVCVALTDSLRDQAQCAQIMTAHEAPPSPAPLWRGERYRHDRIRIAYVSADFHAHATAALMAGVFEHHDRNRFEITAISFGKDDKSEMRARVIASFDRFIDVRERSDAEIAGLMRQMEIDIAVDLKGYTQDHRSGIFAHRPAPVQASYLGYPGTMGAPYIDYIVADRTVIPEDHVRYYSEQIAYLPDTYQCNDSRRGVDVGTATTRSEMGLPQSGFVFCCFNNNFKIAPELFDIWAGLLRDIPGSVLWLLEDNADAMRNLRKEAEARGVAAERLVFAPRVNAADHIARHRLADLFLDTMPYGAHTTASDALWAGLPVLTVLGPSFAARVAASLLRAVGLPELITDSMEAYRDLALRLARDSAALDAIRAKLAANRETQPLFDTLRFTRNLEAAYVTMWQRAQRGEPPRGFSADGDMPPRDALPRNPSAQIPAAAAQAFTQGCALAGQNRLGEALSHFEQALAIAPHFVEALINRGAVFMAMKRFADGLQSFDVALGVDSGRFEAWNNRGNALSELGRYAEAVASYDKALAAKPDAFETLVNRGNALLALRRAGDALANYDDALRARRESADAVNGRANALFELKRFDEAIAAYEKLLTLDPARDYAAGILAFSNLQCCDWRTLSGDRQTLAAAIRAGKRVANPFQNLAFSRIPEEQKQCAAIWMADKYPPSPRSLWNGEIYRHDRLRIAYLSADLRDHAVGQAMAGVIEHHDRSRFETIAVTWASEDGSDLRARLKSAFGKIVDAEHETDTAVARRLREMEVDIAVDLMGFTGECRPAILAARAAPIQVNFLGFPGTMSAPYIDYLLADRIVIPESEQGDYAETVIYLPDAYLPADSKRRIANTPTRHEAGLPPSGFVFASFNNSYKFTPELFDIWVRLLAAVEGSVLWLSANPAAAPNLQREARARGIDASRLIFAPLLPDSADHLARLKLADLFLDTLPYNAHATSMDALFAGLPVLTCKGTTFAGRVAASLLQTAGLPDLVTDSLDAYESLALKLAREPSTLAALKAKLAASRDTSALFDTARFTRNLEAAYQAMWDRRRRNPRTG